MFSKLRLSIAKFLAPSIFLELEYTKTGRKYEHIGINRKSGEITQSLKKFAEELRALKVSKANLQRIDELLAQLNKEVIPNLTFYITADKIVAGSIEAKHITINPVEESK